MRNTKLNNEEILFVKILTKSNIVPLFSGSAEWRTKGGAMSY